MERSHQIWDNVILYGQYVLDRFKTLGKSLLACRVGNLGLGIVSLGIGAFTTGIASLSFFSEKTLLEDRPTGGGRDPEPTLQDVA